MTYRVEEKNGWSYVRAAPGDVPPRNGGPYRYRVDAQEYADELNQRDVKFGGETTIVVPRPQR